MKALSLWQPYATLIVVGAKPFETRAYPPQALPPRGYGAALGERIAVHAAKRRPTRGELVDIKCAIDIELERDDLADGERARLMLGRAVIDSAMAGALPLGAVVGTAVLHADCQVGRPVDGLSDRLVTVLRASGAPRSTLATDPFGDYRPGRWCWEMVAPEAFAEPVPAAGRQGWWTWEPR